MTGSRIPARLGQEGAQGGIGKVETLQWAPPTSGDKGLHEGPAEASRPQGSLGHIHPPLCLTQVRIHRCLRILIPLHPS